MTGCRRRKTPGRWNERGREKARVEGVDRGELDRRERETSACGDGERAERRGRSERGERERDGEVEASGDACGEFQRAGGYNRGIM